MTYAILENDTFLKSPTNPHGTTELSTNKDHQVLHDTVTQVELKPLEKRAINYLINEYLLHNEYKLTSITLAEENADQVSLYNINNLRISVASTKE